jgi:hypothetical protein
MPIFFLPLQTAGKGGNRSILQYRNIKGVIHRKNYN